MSSNKAVPAIIISAIIAMSIIALLAKSVSTQNPSGCSSAEKYDSKTKNA